MYRKSEAMAAPSTSNRSLNQLWSTASPTCIGPETKHGAEKQRVPPLLQENTTVLPLCIKTRSSSTSRTAFASTIFSTLRPA
jgi:hypothetical protein